MEALLAAYRHTRPFWVPWSDDSFHSDHFYLVSTHSSRKKIWNAALPLLTQWGSSRKHMEKNGRDNSVYSMGEDMNSVYSTFVQQTFEVEMEVTQNSLINK
jgi:hypothetical protein